MKKKLIGLFGIALGIALASCGYQDQKLSTSKDFDVTIPEVDSNAKLLTGEEKTEYIAKASSYHPIYNDVEEYMKGYSSIVGVFKEYYHVDDYQRYSYRKSIIDYKNQNYWYYEKYMIVEKGVTFTNEAETKIVFKDDNFIVKTSISLDGHPYKESDEYGLNMKTSKVSGKADIYTTISNDYFQSFANGFLPYINEAFYSNKEGYVYLGGIMYYEPNSLYVSDNYSYCKAESNILDLANKYYKYVSVENTEFLGSYYIENISESYSRESYSEYYLIKDDILDNSINLDNAKEYTFNENSYYHKMIPYYDISVNSGEPFFGTNRAVTDIPEDVLKSNFTFTEVKEN